MLRVLFFATAFIFSCADYPRVDEIEHTLKHGEEFTDTRNQEVYKTVIIGEQIWMARNLNFSVEKNSLCYGNDTINCRKYGRLYDWAAAMNISEEYDTVTYTHPSKHQGICPSGWHLPSDTEWQTLVEYIGTNVGVKLRAKEDWSDKNDRGDDDYGFAAKPSGFYFSGFRDMVEENEIGYWWSSTEFILDKNLQAYYRDVNTADELSQKKALKTYMFAVRCVKD